jgi:hypothetical protein
MPHKAEYLKLLHYWFLLCVGVRNRNGIFTRSSGELIFKTTGLPSVFAMTYILQKAMKEKVEVFEDHRLDKLLKEAEDAEKLLEKVELHRIIPDAKDVISVLEAAAEAKAAKAKAAEANAAYEAKVAEAKAAMATKAAEAKAAMETKAATEAKSSC